MSRTMQALWLKAESDPIMTVDKAEYPVVGESEVVIKTTAVAINPADWILQRTGAILTTYPAILGTDAAGIVQEEYVVLKEPYIAKVPDGTRDQDAVVLPLGLYTANSCLFAKETLGLDLPSLKAAVKGKVLIVWGASSSVGSCGLQLAKAAGYDVLAVASERNFAMLRGLGAGECFDYHDNDVVEKVVEALKGKIIVGGYDAVSTAETIGAMCDILARCDDGARKLVVGVKPEIEGFAKEGVQVRNNFGVDQMAFGTVAGEKLWKDFLPTALEAGDFQCKPDAEIVGHGLGKIQEAVDILADRGVSAKKLVVTL